MPTTHSTPDILETLATPSTVGSMHTDLLQEMIALRNAVAREDWPEVRQAGLRCIGLGHGARRMIEGQAAALARRGAATRGLAEDLDATLRALAEIDDAERRHEVFDEFRRSLEAAMGDLPAALSDALDKLRRGDTDGVSLFGTIMRPELLARVPGPLRVVKDAVIAARTRGLLGLVHADFNMAFAKAEPNATMLVESGLRETLRTTVDACRTTLRERQAGLQKALAEQRGADDVKDSLDALEDFVERRMPALAGVQASMYVSADALRRAGKGGEAEQMGDLAARAGGLSREAIASYTAANRLAIELALPQPDEEVVELRSSAKHRPFDTRLPNGKDTELAKLAEVPDGTFVEVRGFVQAHEALRMADGKLVSRLRIVDPSSGATARAAAIFTELAHAGVTPGAFCRINGGFRKQSALLDDQPGIEIDRLALAPLAEKSWWVALLRSAARWFEPWRNGSNLVWALGPYHVVDDGSKVDEAASRFGAGELIFTPFIRD